MFTNTLKMTRFEVEKLASANKRNRAVPYLINTFRGKRLGLFGRIGDNEQPASNDPDFSGRSVLQLLLYSLGW